MTELEPLIRFWRAHDARFERAEQRWWGAVVSDRRYPRVREANYARVETRQPIGLEEIEADLLPAMADVGSRHTHVVIFFPEDQTDLLAQASTRGERLTWDLLMEHRGPAGVPETRARPVEEIVALDDAFWRAHRDSTRLFDVSDEEVLDQLQAIERQVLIPAGRRWFAVLGRGGPVALAALLALDGVAYVDHVVTVPAARRRGHASALTARLVAEAASAGAGHTYLLAEPDGIAAAMYARRGFRPVTQIASWVSAIDPDEESSPQPWGAGR